MQKKQFGTRTEDEMSVRLEVRADRANANPINVSETAVEKLLSGDLLLASGASFDGALQFRRRRLVAIETESFWLPKSSASAGDLFKRADVESASISPEGSLFTGRRSELFDYEKRDDTAAERWTSNIDKLPCRRDVFFASKSSAASCSQGAAADHEPRAES